MFVWSWHKHVIPFSWCTVVSYCTATLQSAERGVREVEEASWEWSWWNCCYQWLGSIWYNIQRNSEWRTSANSWLRCWRRSSSWCFQFCVAYIIRFVCSWRYTICCSCRCSRWLRVYSNRQQFVGCGIAGRLRLLCMWAVSVRSGTYVPVLWYVSVCCTHFCACCAFCCQCCTHA